MKNRIFLVALISLSAFSLHAMNKEEANQYIRNEIETHKGQEINLIGSQSIELPNGKKQIVGRIPSDGGWVNVRKQFNADGTPDESFGPQGLRAE